MPRLELKMKYVETSEKIDLTNWGMDGGPFDDITPRATRAIMAQVTKIIQDQFDENPPALSFPIEWGDSDGRNGGRIVDDPATVYVDLPLGSHEDTCVYACSLEVAIDSFIELHEHNGDGKIKDEETIADAKLLIARLRELASKLENALMEEGKP